VTPFKNFQYPGPSVDDDLFPVMERGPCPDGGYGVFPFCLMPKSSPPLPTLPQRYGFSVQSTKDGYVPEAPVFFPFASHQFWFSVPQLCPKLPLRSGTIAKTPASALSRHLRSRPPPFDIPLPWPRTIPLASRCSLTNRIIEVEYPTQILSVTLSSIYNIAKIASSLDFQSLLNPPPFIVPSATHLRWARSPLLLGPIPS